MQKAMKGEIWPPGRNVTETRVCRLSFHSLIDITNTVCAVFVIMATSLRNLQLNIPDTCKQGCFQLVFPFLQSEEEELHTLHLSVHVVSISGKINEIPSSGFVCGCI